jgi:hypothetical protein
MGGTNFDLKFSSSFAVGLQVVTGQTPPPNEAQSIFDDDIQLVVPGLGVAGLDAGAVQATLGESESVYFVGLIDERRPFTTAQIRYAPEAVGTISFRIDNISTTIPQPSAAVLLALVSFVICGSLALRRVRLLGAAGRA